MSSVATRTSPPPPEKESPPAGPASSPRRWQDLFSLSLLENRYPALHGLRLIAIVCVVISHNNETLSASAIEMNRRFWWGMDFFFIMSGFLIGSILLHSIDRSGLRTFGRFYLRRSFRVLPAYYFALGILLVRQARVNGWEALHFEQWKELAFLTNYPFAPFQSSRLMPWSWSLSLEEHFYLLSPFLIFGLLRLKSGWRATGLGILFLVPLLARLVGVGQGEDFFVRIFTPTHFRFDPLIAGVLIAYVLKYHREEVQRWMDRPGRLSACFWVGVGLVAVMTFSFSLPQPYSGQPLPHPVWGALYCGTVTSVAFGLLIVWAIFSRGKGAAVLGCGAARRMATLGYGIYLFHIPAIEMAHRILGPVGWSFTLALGLGLAGAAAYITHLLIEKPFLWLRDRLT